LKHLKKNLSEEKELAEKEGRKVALYFHDEAGFSLTTEVGYTWFKKGERPEIKASVSRQYWHLSAAADPESGDICPMMLDWLNTETFQQFLDEFAIHVKPRIDEGYEIWIAVDRASWHIAKDLIIPRGIRLIIMPTGAAMINPIETLWEYIRRHFMKNRIHKTLEELSDTLYKACRELLDSAKKVISICHTSIIPKCMLA
jgi:transposase